MFILATKNMSQMKWRTDSEDALNFPVNMYFITEDFFISVNSAAAFYLGLHSLSIYPFTDFQYAQSYLKQMSPVMRFPTMWYVRPANLAQTSMRILAV